MNFCQFYVRFTTLRALRTRKTKFSILTICYGIASTCIKKKKSSEKVENWRRYDFCRFYAGFTTLRALCARKFENEIKFSILTTCYKISTTCVKRDHLKKLKTDRDMIFADFCTFPSTVVQCTQITVTVDIGHDFWDIQFDTVRLLDVKVVSKYCIL